MWHTRQSPVRRQWSWDFVSFIGYGPGKGADKLLGTSQPDRGSSPGKLGGRSWRSAPCRSWGGMHWAGEAPRAGHQWTAVFRRSRWDCFRPFWALLGLEAYTLRGHTNLTAASFHPQNWFIGILVQAHTHTPSSAMPGSCLTDPQDFGVTFSCLLKQWCYFFQLLFETGERKTMFTEWKIKSVRSKIISVIFYRELEAVSL